MKIFIALILLLGLAVEANAQQPRRQHHGGVHQGAVHQRFSVPRPQVQRAVPPRVVHRPGANIVGARPVQPYQGQGYYQPQPQYYVPPQQPYYGNNNGYYQPPVYGHIHRDPGADLALGIIGGAAVIVGGALSQQRVGPQPQYHQQRQPEYQELPPIDGVRWVRPGEGNFRPIPQQALQRFSCNLQLNMVFQPFGTGTDVRAPRVCLSPYTGYVLAYQTTSGQWFAGKPEQR